LQQNKKMLEQRMWIIWILTLLAVVSSDNSVQGANEPVCKPIGQIYKNGKELCERIYSNAFRYVPVGDPEYNLSYTMWFFTEDNPNDETTRQRVQAGLLDASKYPKLYDQCYLASNITFQKEFPSANNASMSECVPFRKHNCCKPETVINDDALDVEYGPTYKWDRCGPMSPQCQRFFVQEDCMYECDPNIGLYRLYPPGDPSAPGNEWVVSGMPIKGDYCDNWFESCQYDAFCGDGDFFSCSAEYQAADATKTSNSSLSSGAIAGIVIGSVAGFLLLVFSIVLIYRERKGRPVFAAAMDAQDSKPINQSAPVGTGSNVNQQDQIASI
jgi:folate receptor